MNHPEDLHERIHGPYYFYDQNLAYIRIQHIWSSLALIVLGYYVLSFFDAWPSWTQRAVYELTIRTIPSHAIYLLQHIMMRFGRFSDQDLQFRRDDFGKFEAKEEAIQRILGKTRIPSVLNRARSLSGYDKLLPQKTESGPPGLGNWDNSCYQNSVLHGLASLPAFQHYLHRSLLLCEKSKVSSNTTDALYQFLDQLSDSSACKRTLWTPKILKSMDSWQQQDAQEYFSRIQDAIEKEALRYSKVLSNDRDSGLNALFKKKTTSKATKEEAARKVVQLLAKCPLDGMLAQALVCQTCGFSEGVSLTQFNCLTVNLGVGGSRSLQCLLDEYTEPELIEGVECDNCTRIAHKDAGADKEDLDEQDVHSQDQDRKKKVLRTKAKQITLARLPKDLVVHINRSIWDNFGNQVKNTSFIQFPHKLNFLGKWCAPLEAGCDTVQATYELRCIVTHAGHHDNGHYVAYAKREKEWYCFNDEIVTNISEQEMLSRGNVFMLFFEMIEQSDLETSDVEVAVETESNTALETSTSRSTSSDDSGAFQEPAVFQPHGPVTIPAMRTAGEGNNSASSETGPGPEIIPAVY